MYIVHELVFLTMSIKSLNILPYNNEPKIMRASAWISEKIAGIQTINCAKFGFGNNGCHSHKNH